MKRLTALLLAAALALSLAACGPEGKAADTVRYGLSNAWDALMPYNSPSGSNYSRIIYDKIYDRLAYVHADGTLEPRAASSWESADGGTAALFHLDEKAAFHDGTPVTAEHWTDTIALLTDPACPTLGRSAFAVLSGTDDTGAAVPGEALGAEAVDKYTLKLTFKTPTTPEDFLLDKNREYYVLPTHLLEGTAPEDVMELALWDEPVGSGPCKFVSETPGSQLVLEANPDYQLGAPGFDRLVITVIDKSNLLTSLIAGDLDYYAFGGNVSVEDAEVARAAGLEVLEGTVPNSFYELMLNNETIPSAAVRRAIDLALDKEALCLHTAQGLGEPAASDLTPGTGYDSGLTWARDVDGAKALLAEGGRSAFAVLSGTDDTGAAVPGEALGAEAVDKYTLKLTFKTPTTPEDFLLDKNREYYVLPTHLLEGTAPEDVMELALWDEPVGSGPCKFVSETPGSQLVLEANPDYQLGAPGFDRLVITVIDKSNLLTSLIAGDLDYYAFGGNVSVEDAEVARAAGLEVLEGTVPNSFYELMLNNETIPSAAVRRAIDLALDKEALCLHTAQGLGEPAASDLTPGTGYDSGLTWARNVDGAKALLAEGGYDGRTYTLACTANRSGLAALMQQELAEAGITVTIETVDSATLFAGMADGKYDMAIASHTPGALPLWFTESRFTADNNLFHVAELTPYTQAIAAVKGAAEHDERQARVEELQALLAGERPFIPLWFGRTLHVQSPTVDGIDYPSSAFSNENVWDWVYRG